MVDILRPNREPRNSLKGEGSSVVTKGEKMVEKILKKESIFEKLLTGSEAQKSAKMEAVYQIAQKYYGEDLVETRFSLGIDEMGNPAIKINQPLVEGTSGDQVTNDQDRELVKTKVKEFQKIWFEQVMKDSAWASLSQDTRDIFQVQDFDPSQVILTPQKQVKIIDW